MQLRAAKPMILAFAPSPSSQDGIDWGRPAMVSPNSGVTESSLATIQRGVAIRQRVSPCAIQLLSRRLTGH